MKYIRTKEGTTKGGIGMSKKAIIFHSINGTLISLIITFGIYFIFWLSLNLNISFFEWYIGWWNVVPVFMFFISLTIFSANSIIYFLFYDFFTVRCGYDN